jgi:oligo-alginate lyase
MKYGPHGGGHGHPDKLNFVLYSRGQILGVDPGTANYGVPIQNEWYKSTLAHNTLTVDETNQAPAEGKSLAFIARPGVSASLAEAGNIYDDIKYRRAVALIGEDTILVLDMAQSDKERTFDFAYHNAGKWSAAPTGEAVNLPNKPGYQHFQDAVKTNFLPPIQVTDTLQTLINVASTPQGETLAGTGVGRNTSDRVPMIVQRVRGQNAAAAWLISLSGANASTISLSQNGATYNVQANVGGKNYRFTVAPDAAERLSLE